MSTESHPKIATDFNFTAEERNAFELMNTAVPESAEDLPAYFTSTSETLVQCQACRKIEKNRSLSLPATDEQLTKIWEDCENKCTRYSQCQIIADLDDSYKAIFG